MRGRVYGAQKQSYLKGKGGGSIMGESEDLEWPLAAKAFHVHVILTSNHVVIRCEGKRAGHKVV